MATALIAVIGREGVGKTQLIRYFKKENFSQTYKFTIGEDLETLSYKDTEIQFIDTAGKDEMGSIAESACILADVAIYCIDLSTNIDIETIKADIAKFRDKNSTATLVLVGTKADLCKDKTALNEIDFTAFGFHNKQIVITSALETSQKRLASDSEADNEPNALLDELVNLARLGKEEFNKRPLSKKIDALAPGINIALNKLLNFLPPQATGFLSPKKEQALVVEINNFVSGLTDRDQDITITQTIQNFHDNCHTILEGKHPYIWNAVISVIAAVLVTAFVGSIGFAIGFAAGAWTGPGAFVSGFVAGSAAVAVVVPSLVTGVAAGGLTAYGIFRANKSPLTEVVDEIVEKAKEIYPPSILAEL